MGVKFNWPRLLASILPKKVAWVLVYRKLNGAPGGVAPLSPPDVLNWSAPSVEKMTRPPSQKASGTVIVIVESGGKPA